MKLLYKLKIQKADTELVSGFGGVPASSSAQAMDIDYEDGPEPDVAQIAAECAELSQKYICLASPWAQYSGGQRQGFMLELDEFVMKLGIFVFL